ncbi:MAG: DMT family transporter [Candidatus Kariarchaeaceae archaeon]
MGMQRKEAIQRTDEHTARFYGSLAIFVGIITVSTAAVLFKLTDASPTITAFWRLFFATIILSLFSIISGNRAQNIKEWKGLGKSWFLVLLSGLALSIHFVSWFTSLELTSVAASVVLVDSSPLIVLFLTYFFLKETISQAQLVGILIALIGAFIIGWGDFQGDNLVGDLLALLGALAVAIYFTIGRHLRQHLNIYSYVIPVYGSCAFFLMIGALLMQESFFDYTNEQWGYFLALAILPSVLGHTMFNYAIKELPASVVSTATLGEPVGAALLAYFFLTEIPSSYDFIGGLIILGGILITIWQPKKREKKAD